MSGKRKRKHGDWAQRHVRLHYWMMRSPAWADLSPAARALLIELYALYNGVNNGELFLSIRSAARRLSIAGNTAGKAFRELEAHGFIRAARRGAFHLKIRHATSWVLTEFEFAGKLATRDFMRWESPDKNQKPASAFKTNGINSYDRERGVEASYGGDGISG